MFKVTFCNPAITRDNIRFDADEYSIEPAIVTPAMRHGEPVVRFRKNGDGDAKSLVATVPLREIIMIVKTDD
jgi:hypothetical protein